MDIDEARQLGLDVETDKYTVWVGGTEVNDSLLEYDDAIKLADSYRKKEYDDVIVECCNDNFFIGGGHMKHN